jgi:CobQ-like glutamine amidotransferase family enzyme
MSAIRICTVYPDLLGTYGDGGNGEVLVARLAWRGIAVEHLRAPSSAPLPAADLYSLGGGEDGPQVLAAERLRADGTLGEAVAGGAVVLAVCAGFQILGHEFPGADGARHEGLHLLDVTTAKGTGPRAVGEIAVDASVEIPTVSGFENHGGVTTLGEGVEPFGRVRRGVGNGGDGTEGARAGRILATYLHGPVLARNCQLADLLLGWVVDGDLQPLDDAGPEGLRAERLASLGLS